MHEIDQQVISPEDKEWFLDHKSMATGLLLLYIPPDWSLRQTWSVKLIVDVGVALARNRGARLCLDRMCKR